MQTAGYFFFAAFFFATFFFALFAFFAGDPIPVAIISSSNCQRQFKQHLQVL
jgi:hypothetical protein